MTLRDDQSAAFELASASSDLARLREAVLALQKDKALAAVARTPTFSRGLETIGRLTRSGPDEARLAALALLFRIAAVAKARRSDVESFAAQVTEDLSVLPQALPDPDDRRYVGEALAHARGAWKEDYLARAT